MIKQSVFILVAVALGIEPASASGMRAKYPGQSQRSPDSGYCPGVLGHVYHISDCARIYHKYYQAHPEVRPK
jgi:hypothetical protein